MQVPAQRVAAPTEARVAEEPVPKDTSPAPRDERALREAIARDLGDARAWEGRPWRRGDAGTRAQYGRGMTCTRVLVSTLVLFACGPTNSDDSGASSTGTGASTSTSTSTGSSGDAPTSGATSTTNTVTTGAATTGGTTTGGLDTGEGTTVDITTAAGPGSETGEDSSSGGTTGPTPDGLVLDPDTLEVFWLPINSIRAGVGGWDEATNTCVTVIFFFGGVDDVLAEHCMFDPMGFIPYVVITPNSGPPCDQWEYGGNVEVVSAAGCQQVTNEEPLTMDIDMTLQVSGDLFTGQITVKSP